MAYTLPRDEITTAIAVDTNEARKKENVRPEAINQSIIVTAVATKQGIQRLTCHYQSNQSCPRQTNTNHRRPR